MLRIGWIWLWRILTVKSFDLSFGDTKHESNRPDNSLISNAFRGVDVVLKGYEGGVDNVVNVKLVRIKKDVNDEWYYGKHEIDEGGDAQVVYIQREERKPTK